MLGHLRSVTSTAIISSQVNYLLSLDIQFLFCPLFKGLQRSLDKEQHLYQEWWNLPLEKSD